ncbi:MAG: phycobilisome protein [Geminocystis sp.]|nr:phycobilisome protein [Geminocystis sp.]MDW8463760.1 phycobilisome protein [Geminocystis sp.]HIK37514.1 phycobilisome protein [Geminocystis sp. M7585_C2015_104]
MLTERAKELIPKARIFSLETVKNIYPERVISIFQEADDEGKYLSDSDMEEIANLVPFLRESLENSKTIRDKAQEIVEGARKEVLKAFPEITGPGGELYPPNRAEACWRDLWHFLRCISYAIAGKIEQFTSDFGLANMELLYQELKVPLPAMVLGLEKVKTYSLYYFSEEQKSFLSPYFDHLIERLKQFKSG